MNRKIKHLRIVSLVIYSIQIIGVILVTLLYVFNVFNLKSLMLPEYFAFIAAGLTVFNSFYILIVLHSIYKIRQKSDIRTVDIVGSDIKEAYMFGKLGFAITDENNKVLWTSDLLQQRQINIINKNIYDWCPKLKDLIDKDVGDVVKVFQNNSYYEVKYLRNANLFIFKDISDYVTLDKFSKEQSICIGIIMIDNYSDVVGTNDDYNDLIARVKNVIFDYAKEYNILLRHFRNDAYFCVCNYASLEKMIDDEFSLLDKVRSLGISENNQATLSIGFAHDFPDVNKLNSMASNAIDIAMSRGGDQAVVSRYGSELEFFGGKTEAIEKRNKVKVRVVADSLTGLISRASNIIIMGHTDMDMDAIGSALGIKAICDSFNKSSAIVYDPKYAEKKVRTAMASLFTNEQLTKMIVPIKEAKEKVKPQTLVIVVDVSKPSMVMAPQVLEVCDKVVVIDHHRRAEEFIENPVLSYIEPSASSASELVAEIIKFSTANSKIKLDPTFATIMLSGIFLDTGFYKSRTVGLRTFEASGVLKEYGADNAVADDLLKDEYEEYALVNKILASLKTPYYGVVYCNSGDDDIVERSTLAKVANQCMQLKGINACFVIGKTNNNEIRISARSDGTINVQVLCEKLGGGGHFSMAAAAFKDKNSKQVESLLLETLDEYLSDARAQQAKKED